ncbi:polyphosphate kinase 1 [Desertivirga arenae]|uniref:polyphosphate kinase 1 n=1 Tax=Desertivirga arenae TaxID=2810309 RepID=UPI001A968641|nr:polyphosphate kinase 1 [Pedobacter sp. SYSU D00823]
MSLPLSSFFNRDLSWLSFNERILLEAAKEYIPLLERLKFLSIYSSNLDEFYRVRMPAVRALSKINKKKASRDELLVLPDVIDTINETITIQQRFYGEILERIIPRLNEDGIELIYKQGLPDEVATRAEDYFFTHLLAFLQIVPISESESFFPENNKLYQLAITLDGSNEEKAFIIVIPSENVPRFWYLSSGEKHYVVFIDDIIRYNLSKLPGFEHLKEVYSFKVTRDAELDIADEYEGDLAEKIEKQIEKRDYGFATRLLYDASIPAKSLNILVEFLRFEKATLVEGGRYHNLKDLSSFPVKNSKLSFNKWPAVPFVVDSGKLLLDMIAGKDILINAPFQSYDNVVRFFNEAAADPSVDNIYITVYRLATDSRIANALITAAKNGKKVSVFVELKARFDEANNIKWSKKMKAAGIKIIYSIPSLKVHAKIALVTRRNGRNVGIFSTGNFNEVTANFYTDHILLTSNSDMLTEVEKLFLFLEKRRKPEAEDFIDFRHLMVAQFNLQERFLQLIDREIHHAKQGLEAQIMIKLNNLEEEKLIARLYQASQAGVKVILIVRGICRLIPGLPGLSENISVRRIIDRYLEHGRIFVFANNGHTEIYMGSADWMYRNIYRRIEVCFPLYDEDIKQTVRRLLNFQLRDNMQAVEIDAHGRNLTLDRGTEPLSSQYEIYEYLKQSASQFSTSS